MTKRKKNGPNPIDVHVGRRVKIRRMELGMSQEKLAAAIGLTFQQVQKYEKGKNRISSSRLWQIAQTLQVPEAFFFEGAPGRSRSDRKLPSGDFVADFTASLDGLVLAKAFVKIKNKKLRRHIAALAAHLAGEE